jgi:hypothetical protein
MERIPLLDAQLRSQFVNEIIFDARKIIFDS